MKERYGRAACPLPMRRRIQSSMQGNCLFGLELRWGRGDVFTHASHNQGAAMGGRFWHAAQGWAQKRDGTTCTPFTRYRRTS